MGKGKGLGKAAASSKAADKARDLLPFAGMTKGGEEALDFRNFTVYTDSTLRCWRTSCWRMRRDGERTDQKASYKNDARQAWDRVNQIIRRG